MPAGPGRVSISHVAGAAESASPIAPLPEEPDPGGVAAQLRLLAGRRRFVVEQMLQTELRGAHDGIDLTIGLGLVDGQRGADGRDDVPGTATWAGDLQSDREAVAPRPLRVDGLGQGPVEQARVGQDAGPR